MFTKPKLVHVRCGLLDPKLVVCAVNSRDVANKILRLFGNENQREVTNGPTFVIILDYPTSVMLGVDGVMKALESIGLQTRRLE